MITNFQKTNQGQIMLLAVLIIGTSILVITSIAGYLMLQRMRASTNIIDSTKAIFAADAGLECELYNRNKTPSLLIDCNNLFFADGLVGIETSTDLNSYIKSIGISNKSKRAFYLSF